MKFKDILVLAFRNLRGNKLRTGLTIAIIGFGIMALVGIITAINASNQKFSESFSSLGADAFVIRYKERNIRFGNDRSGDMQVSKKNAKKEKKSNLNKVITREEAEYFVNNYNFPGAVTGISVFAGGGNVVSFREKKTNPNVTLIGGDENYLNLNAYNLIAGRGMTLAEVRSKQNVCVIGFDIAKNFFGEAAAPRAVNLYINVNNIPYKIVGVLESRGTTFGFSRDNLIITSYGNVSKNFASSRQSYTLSVKVKNVASLDAAMGEAERLFRSVRKISTTEESNFVLDKSEGAVMSAISILRYIKWAAIVIGMITLLGAAIGLMNIMLVSVGERTKEVGLVKAIGGKSSSVKAQFLIEAVIISILGALLGIVLGIVVGNIYALILDTGFVVPWDWVLYGVVICTIVGLAAGLYPAVKAGRLNPIEALRYE
ncbi:MAG: ABC transporter permease [Niabella sp.]